MSRRKKFNQGLSLEDKIAMALVLTTAVVVSVSMLFTEKAQSKKPATPRPVNTQPDESSLFQETLSPSSEQFALTDIFSSNKGAESILPNSLPPSNEEVPEMYQTPELNDLDVDLLNISPLDDLQFIPD